MKQQAGPKCVGAFLADAYYSISLLVDTRFFDYARMLLGIKLIFRTIITFQARQALHGWMLHVVLSSSPQVKALRLVSPLPTTICVRFPIEIMEVAKSYIQRTWDQERSRLFHVRLECRQANSGGLETVQAVGASEF